MYERIVIPTDGSTGTAHVAMQALDLADQYGGTVHVVHVVDETARSLLEATGSSDQLRQEGEQAVERIAKMAGNMGVDTVTEVLEGDPADTILDYAADVDADLVVAGTHGRSGVERRLIGSVAERLVRHADCPVMTVRLPEDDVTVRDADAAEELALESLRDLGHDDPRVAGTERQQHVWVVDAEATDGEFVVYVDPVTRRTSPVPVR